MVVSGSRRSLQAVNSACIHYKDNRLEQGRCRGGSSVQTEPATSLLPALINNALEKIQMYDHAGPLQNDHAGPLQNGPSRSGPNPTWAVAKTLGLLFLELTLIRLSLRAASCGKCLAGPYYDKRFGSDFSKVSTVSSAVPFLLDLQV